MENEEKDFRDLIAENIGLTGTELSEMEIGSEERARESKIFNDQAKLVLEEFKTSSEVAQNDEKLLIERERMEKEMELKREIEMAKLELDKKRNRTERATLWTKAGLTALEIGSGIYLGWLYLKVNMKYGGFVGKDGKKIWDEIKKIRV